MRNCSFQTEFQEVVYGYLDTFLLSKNLFRLYRYSQQYMVQHFLKKTYNAHNAMDDARMLQELYNKWSPDKRSVSRFTYEAKRVV